MVVAPVTASSSVTDRQDATFVETAGLANPACVSFESVNKPGSYLRHQNFQFHLQPSDGSALFSMDATFCPGTGNSGQGTSFQSVNFPGRFIRNFGNVVFLAPTAGPTRGTSLPAGRSIGSPMMSLYLGYDYVLLVCSRREITEAIVAAIEPQLYAAEISAPNESRRTVWTRGIS